MPQDDLPQDALPPGEASAGAKSAPAAAAPTTGTLQIVVIAVGDDEYALPVTRVQEVVPYTRPRPLPRSDPNVRGVIRGRVIPVVSARAAFGLPDAELSPDARRARPRRRPGGADRGRRGRGDERGCEAGRARARAGGRRLGGGLEAVVRLEDRLLVILDVEALLDSARRGLDLSYATEPALEHEEDEAGPEPEPEPEPEQEPAETREVIDPEDIEAVRAMFAMLEPHQERAVVLFSTRLREVDPGLHARMGLDDPARGRRFMAALRLSVRGLDRLEDLVPALRALGVRVDAGAVTPAECRTAIDAFLWTLQRGLGRRFDPDSRQVCGATAWTLIGILSRAGGGA